MKTVLVVAIALVAFSASSYAQDRASWSSLLLVQKNERDALYNRQHSELALLIEIQKAHLAQSSGDERREMSKQYVVERQRLSIRHSAERTEMMKIHQQERVEFNKPPAKPTAMKLYLSREKIGL